MVKDQEVARTQKTWCPFHVTLPHNITLPHVLSGSEAKICQKKDWRMCQELFVRPELSSMSQVGHDQVKKQVSPTDSIPWMVLPVESVNDTGTCCDSLQKKSGSGKEDLHPIHTPKWSQACSWSLCLNKAGNIPRSHSLYVVWCSAVLPSYNVGSRKELKLSSAFVTQI